MRKIIAFVICISIPLAVGGGVGFATSSAIDSWYAGLNKPNFNPPNELFGPVWSTLYFLMGVTLFLIWQAYESEDRKRALRLFVLQLVLNAAWSFIFFYFHLPAWAFVEIIILWIFIVLWIVQTFKVNKVAGFLQIPYLLWVSFASVLNGAIWYLN